MVAPRTQAHAYAGLFHGQPGACSPLPGLAAPPPWLPRALLLPSTTPHSQDTPALGGSLLCCPYSLLAPLLCELA